MSFSPEKMSGVCPFGHFTGVTTSDKWRFPGLSGVGVLAFAVMMMMIVVPAALVVTWPGDLSPWIGQCPGRLG
jgi:hypothetical protein